MLTFFQDAAAIFDQQQDQYQLVRELGEEIVKRSKAKDTSFVTGVLNNVDVNWKSLSDLLELR